VISGDVVNNSYHLQYPSDLARQYGVTGFAWSGFFNSKTSKGKLTHTQFGPRAEPPKTYRVPEEISWLDPAQMAGGLDHMKGTDTVSGWHNQDTGVMETQKDTHDAKTELTVTGEPNKKYNVALSANAVEWHLGVVLTAVGVTFIDKPVPCSDIFIMSVPLNADCQVSLDVLPGVYDITPASKAKRYIYSVNTVQNIIDSLQTQTQNLQQRIEAEERIGKIIGDESDSQNIVSALRTRVRQLTTERDALKAKLNMLRGARTTPSTPLTQPSPLLNAAPLRAQLGDIMESLKAVLESVRTVVR
jgi:hypothetical protein